MHSKNDKTEIMSHDKAGEVLEKLFESLLSRYQIGLETSMRSSDLFFDYVNLLYYVHKIDLNRGGSRSRLDKKRRSNNKSHK